MQVTPVVAREWAAESGCGAHGAAHLDGYHDLVARPERNVKSVLVPGKGGQDYRNSPGAKPVSSPHIMPDPAVR